MFDPLGILISFMQEKSRLLKEDWPGIYFTNDDAINMLDWKLESVLNVLEKLINIKAKFAYHISDADICPFCIYYYDDQGLNNCDDCTYHSKCMVADGEWENFKWVDDMVRPKTIAPIVWYIKIQSYRDIHRLVRKASNMSIPEIRKQIKKLERNIDGI